MNADKPSFPNKATMPPIHYPILRHANDVLKAHGSAELRFAQRQREASQMCGHTVCFVTETIEPRFPDKDQAIVYYQGHYPEVIELDACKFVCVLPTTAKKSKPIEAIFATSKRWPDPKPTEPSVWQLSLSYWKVMPKSYPATKPFAHCDHKLPASAFRKHEDGQNLSADEIKSLSNVPLIPNRPQKALDIGLFEYRPPDNPNIIIADE